MLKPRFKSIYIPMLFLFLSGCVLGPDYQKPETLVPIQYKNDAPWKNATPSDMQDKGSWWGIYADETLNGLELQAEDANQTLKAAYARLMQAKATAGISKATKLPSVDLSGFAQRSRVLLNKFGFDTGPSGILFNYYTISSNLNYEVDLFGRVKRTVEAAEADMESATADFQALMLLLQSDLASSYFALRSTDTEISLLERTLELRKAGLEIVQGRYKHGLVDVLDPLRARTELASTKADLIGLRKQRGELENLIALLIGKYPSNFILAPAPLKLSIPATPPGLPSSLLERRPDVASAERQMAAASARIGVAETAFFPAISLTGSAGLGSSQISNLFNWDNRSWSLGPAISLPIFDGGRNSNNLERARAAYEEAIANYRQQVLVAFQEVEDGLKGLQILKQQSLVLQQAVDAATQAWQVTEKRYKVGLISYLEVIDAERTALQFERLLNQNRGQQMTTSVQLVKALGGGWRTAH